MFNNHNIINFNLNRLNKTLCHSALVPVCLKKVPSFLCLKFLLLITLLTISSNPAQAKTQTLNLKTGWNLVSLSVNPVNSAVDSVFDPLITSGEFVSVWTFNAVSEKWSTYPAAIPGVDVITNIEVGKGYWVEVHTSSNLDIAGDDSLPSGELDLTSGWNLVGFPLDEPKEYSFFLANVPLTQIWTYDSNAGEFKGVEFAAGTSTTTREDFSMIEPGKAYWIYSGEAYTLGPVLGTSMEGDKDVSPFRDHTPPGAQVPWTPFSQGDEDIGGDGFFDTPTTQRAMTFRDVAETGWIYIKNLGSGVLNYNAEILNPESSPWVRILEYDELEETYKQVVTTSGSVSTTSTRLRMAVDRTQMTPGHYTATLSITSNSRNETEPRLISLHMDVASIEGDYKLIAQIDTVNGKKADMPNPRYFLSLYKDTDDPTDDSIKGIIDENRSLLMPNRFYMAGQYYETQTNNFIVSGSLMLPPKDTQAGDQGLNPYKVDLRRDIILIGDRKGADDHGMGPLDLKGEYRETIINVLEEPIYISGTFVAYRINKKATTMDINRKIAFGSAIPDGTAYVEKTFNVPPEENVLITELDISPTIVHNRPEDLLMTLTSPDNKTVILRDHSPGDVGKVVYDEDTEPLESLDLFIGGDSSGDWILRIEDTNPGVAGELVACSLDIKGTKVYTVTGRILNVPEGTIVNLSGCGITKTAEVDADGNFTFTGLIDCNYEIILLDQGYNPIYLRLTVDGEDLVLSPIIPEKIQSTNPDFMIGPQLSGEAPLEITLTDITTLAGGSSYSYDWTVIKTSAEPTADTLLVDQGFKASHTINTAGTYQVEMKIYQLPDRSTPIHTVLKSTKIVVYDPPLPGADRLMFISTAGGGGLPAAKKEVIFDSSTFDVDRYPLVSTSPVDEADTDVFGGLLDVITLTNNLKLSSSGPEAVPVGDGSIDSAHSQAVNNKRIFIHIGMGQPFIGTATSGGLKMSVGGKP